MSMPKLSTATFAGGCFWCTEAVFKRLKGVVSASPGYAGGSTDHPHYEDVSSGETSHAEAIQVEYDPSIISYDQLLGVFFATHDPTTPDRQGADVGTQYRSAIFYFNDVQQSAAEEKIKELESSKKFGRPIVTQILPFTNFYPAENFHKDYYDKHQDAPYCQLVIDPKIKKLYRDFKTIVKAQFYDTDTCRPATG